MYCAALEATETEWGVMIEVVVEQDVTLIMASLRVGQRNFALRFVCTCKDNVSGFRYP